MADDALFLQRLVRFSRNTDWLCKMFGFVLIGYLIVMVFDFQRIKKIPMDQALKIWNKIL